MKTSAHTMFALVFLALSITLLSSGSAHAESTVMGDSQVFNAAEVKGLPGAQSGSGPGCQTGAGGFAPLECFEGSRKLSDAYSTAELGPFLQKVFVGAISLGAMLAVLRLAWAGFLYMGTDLWSDKQKAHDIIKDTLLGLFLLIAIWLILYQINPDILKFEINT